MAKDEGAPYRPGTWFKLKVRHEGRFRIGGLAFEDGRVAGVLVGEPKGDALAYRGAVDFGVRRPVVEVLLEASRVIARSSSPFADLRRGRDVVWLEPELVTEVIYAEVMQGRLRDPVFRSLALRDQEGLQAAGPAPGADDGRRAEWGRTARGS